MSWSSGKDSALALHETRTAGGVEVVGLLTTLDAAADRVAMHGVRRSLLDSQAKALDLPLYVVDLPWPCPNDVYEELMTETIAEARACDIDVVVFGDLFLEDIRRYRERMLAGSGLSPRFPLWRQPTDAVARRLVSLGVRAVVTCVDLRQASVELAGRWYDESFLADLPPGVDPCGENGEFHTLVVDAPGFAHPLDVTIGETVEHDGFAYTDIVPGASSPTESR